GERPRVGERHRARGGALQGHRADGGRSSLHAARPAARTAGRGWVDSRRDDGGDRAGGDLEDAGAVGRVHLAGGGGVGDQRAEDSVSTEGVRGGEDGRGGGGGGAGRIVAAGWGAFAVSVGPSGRSANSPQSDRTACLAVPSCRRSRSSAMAKRVSSS